MTLTYSLHLHDALPISHIDEQQVSWLYWQMSVSRRLVVRVRSVGIYGYDGAMIIDQGVAAEAIDEELLNLPFCHGRSEEHTSELQSPCNIVCSLTLEKK